MKCPKDGGDLRLTEVLGVQIDTCPTCDGCWLDPGELAQMQRFGGREPLPLELIDLRRTRFVCPRCQAPLEEGSHPTMPALRLERCSGCGGLFLDRGELTRVLLASGRQAAAAPAHNLWLGRFEIQGELLAGRFSTLYRALDRVSQQPVVLRRLDDSMPSGPAGLRLARAQMHGEGRLLARLEHRNLPRVLQAYDDGRHFFLALEDFSGQTLADQLKEAGGPLDARLVRRYLEQLLAVVGYLHSQDPPVIHRDLRPDTVLVTAHGVLKIAEFGLAKIHEQGGEGVTAFRSHGSPLYAAPEQLLGAPSSPRNDIYSIGAVLYLLATATEPPPAKERFFNQVSLAPIDAVRPDFPADLARLIHDLMEPEDHKRLQTVADAQRRLFDLAPEEVEPAPAPARPAGGNGEPVLAAAPAARQAAGGVARMAQAVAHRLSNWQLLFGKKAGRPQTAAAPALAAPGLPELESFPTVDLAELSLERQVGRLLPKTVSRSIRGVCIAASETELTVAVEDPTQVHIYDHVSYATQGKQRARPVRADARLINKAREFIYDVPDFAEEMTWNQFLERKKLDEVAVELRSAAAQVDFGMQEDITSPIIEAVDRLIKEAIASGTSDIHLETYEKSMVVRYRTDGVLTQVASFPSQQAGAIVKRIKIMANMDIAQDRVTQGGRISVKVGETEIDLRVSVVPVPAGENVVMRLLRKGAFNLTLSDLGFEKEYEARYRHIIAQPYGIILVSGPTGSGKSTTLYASLREISRPDRKLLTVEDPIEYQMPGITQVQVNMAPREEDKKVTFARALREFLRQDPDVILVGEIRDPETAKIAIQAALTGHLVLSTIHTNDSIGIVARLRDMGVEPYLIGSTLIGGLAQRLARRICSHCKEEMECPAGYVDRFRQLGLESPHVFRGRGCRDCNNTGYKGRVAVYEILEVGPEIRALISSVAQEEQIRQAARGRGFRTLYEEGLVKCSRGATTLEEVERVCMTI